MFSALKRETLLSNGQVFDWDKWNYCLKYKNLTTTLPHPSHSYASAMQVN